jgi:hypothetical protein
MQVFQCSMNVPTAVMNSVTEVKECLQTDDNDSHTIRRTMVHRMELYRRA